MIVTERELNRSQYLFKWIEDRYRIDPLSYHADRAEARVEDFLVNSPHLVMLLGFDEFRCVGDADDEPGWQTGAPSRVWQLLDVEYHMCFRSRASGAWFWYHGISPDFAGEQDQYLEHVRGACLTFSSRPLDEEATIRNVPLSNLLSAIQGAVARPDEGTHTLVLPSIWSPRVQAEQRILLAQRVPEILKAVHLGQRSLRDIGWRDLEDLVAEILRSFGLQIYVTPRTHDGGRDIIGRGELISGEPQLIAVEVKQKAVVGLGDVQRALYANRDFPALLVATAGRFSGGVVEERQLPHNQLRLFLKDGIALRQWIDTYAQRTGRCFGK